MNDLIPIHETSARPVPHGTVALTVSYNGAPFAGFARQPEQQTVQGSLEIALSTLFRREIDIAVAGRTDAGVHALGQVVSFDLLPGEEPDFGELLRSLGGLCKPDIAVTQVRSARPGFSARFDAVGREYRYRIVSGPTAPVFLAPYAWWVKRGLDLDAMNQAAQVLLGEHDFASFCVADSAEGKPTRRNVRLIEVLPECQLGEQGVTVRVVGNAFLHSMVRVIVGSLVDVGTGRRTVEWMAEALAARSRAAAGPTAPAHGLSLWHVDYPDGVWL